MLAQRCQGVTSIPFVAVELLNPCQAQGPGHFYEQVAIMRLETGVHTDISTVSLPFSSMIVLHGADRNFPCYSRELHKYLTYQ